MRVRAVYDNDAETPDELSFRRDDILVVLEVDTDGIEGWWLCALGQKMGIAPANRLKVISHTSPPIVAAELKIIIPRQDVYPASDYDVPQCMSPDVGTLSVPRIGGKLTKSYSAGDLLAATSDDYDTPTSDYDTPVSHPRETNSAQKDAKSKVVKNKTGKKIKNFFRRDQRSSVATLDQDLYDTPTPSKRTTKSASQKKTESVEKLDAKIAKDKSGRKTKNQLNPEVCRNDDCDSSLSDYDVPYSSAVSTNQNAERHTGARTKSPSQRIASRERIECPQDLVTNSQEDCNKSLNHMSAPKLDDLRPTFDSLRMELLVVLQQINDNSSKWFLNKNALTRASVVRLSCFSAWKKLQTLMGCVSQISIRIGPGSNLSDHLKSLGEQSNSLEKIIEFLTTQNSETLEKDNGSYINAVVSISDELQRLLQLVTTNLHENKTKFATENTLQKPTIMITMSSMDDLDGGSKVTLTDEIRKKAALSKSKSSSNLSDASPNITAVKCEIAASRSLDNILGGEEDYDTPTNRSHIPTAPVIPATLRENRNITLLKHNADVKSFDVVKEKRGAVVMDKGEHKFDILVRKHSDCKMAPSVMVFGIMKGEERGDSDIEEAVDYDYPLPSTEVETQNHMSLADKQLLQFYTNSVMNETTCMKMACSQLFQLKDSDDSSNDADIHKTVIALARIVLVSVHKLSFIGDTILKNLLPSPLKVRIQQRCEELCNGDNIKSVLMYTKISATAKSLSSVQSRQRLAETTKDILWTAIAFSDIVARPR